ncbi:MAG: hypothetical protein ABJE95_32860 [Byssovorax sp.]
MSGPLVDFTAGPQTPAVELNFLGIALQIEARSSHGDLTALRLHGLYRVSIDDARAVGAIPLQKALVVTATSGLRHRSWNLVGQTVTFDDDEQSGAGVVRGYFNADLLPFFNVASYGTGYVVVSLGTLISNVVTFTATT